MLIMLLSIIYPALEFIFVDSGVHRFIDGFFQDSIDPIDSFILCNLKLFLVVNQSQH